MKPRKKTYGGTRPVCTSQPVMVTGGFNLDKDIVNVEDGTVVPAGTLASFDETSRKMVILKTARVKSIDKTDSKILTLHSDEFLVPIFSVGESIVKEVSGNFADAPKIVKIENKASAYIITLDKEISGVAVDDIIQQVIKAEDGKAVRSAKTYPALVIVDGEAGLDEVNIDVTIDTDYGAFYERRIPPIPSDLKSDNGMFLATNPNIKLSKSY